MKANVARRGADTRERILDAAQDAVLAKGFAATSIDEIIAAVSITKSGFFYHFSGKSDLAMALLQRYIDTENGILDDLFGRADELHEDPLHGFLIGLKLLAEMMADLPSTHPGCLVASVCYQEHLFKRAVVDLSEAGMRGWRKRFQDRLELIASRHPPRIAVDLSDLADMVSSLVDGGIVLSKVMKDKQLLPQQLMLYREFIRAIFVGTGETEQRAAPKRFPATPESTIGAVQTGQGPEHDGRGGQHHRRRQGG